MKTKQTIAALTLCLGMIGTAHAGLVGVASIEVRNTINQWLQVAEVMALNVGGTDVALTGTASAPDSWSSISTAANAIDGVTAGDYNLGQIYHEGSDFSHDTLTITLPSAQELASIQIWGRTDCCSDRDIYDVTFKDGAGSILFSLSGLDARGANHNVFATLPNTNQPVPEPTSLALLGLSVFGALAARRGQRRTAA